MVNLKRFLFTDFPHTVKAALFSSVLYLELVVLFHSVCAAQTVVRLET